MFAARLTDMHVCPLVTGIVPHVGGPITGPGIPTVLIGGLPCSVVGDIVTCVGPPDSVVRGASTVLVSGRPMSIMTGTTAHGGTIILGCFTVMVNNPAAGAANAASAAAGMAAQAAAAAGEVAAQAEAAMEEVKDAAAQLEALKEGGISDDESGQFNDLNDDYGETLEALGL